MRRSIMIPTLFPWALCNHNVKDHQTPFELLLCLWCSLGCMGLVRRDLELKLYQNNTIDGDAYYKLVSYSLTSLTLKVCMAGPWMGCTSGKLVLWYISQEGPQLPGWAVWFQDIWTQCRVLIAPRSPDFNHLDVFIW